MNSVKASDIIEWGNVEGYLFEYIGDKDVELIGFSSLRKYKNGSITWINVKNPVDEEVLPRIRCAVIQKGVTAFPENHFVTEESKKFFFAILTHFFSDRSKGIAERENTYIGKNVKRGRNVRIGCNCVLDGEIFIGDNTVIEHNVTMINRITVGSDCIIHSGTVIGKDGFGFSFDKAKIPQKVTHFGGVQIGDRVEIGCNCAVDRGTIDDTIIGDDVKIDSLSVVAHNSEIGNGTLIIGASIGGSCLVGEKSYIAPRAIIKNKTSLGNNCFVGMMAIVNQDVSDNKMVIEGGEKIMGIKDYRRFL